MIKNNSCQDTNLNDLYIVQGDSKDLPLTFWANLAQTQRLDITGYVVYFTVKTKVEDTDDEALIRIDVTNHTNPTQGETTIEIPNTENDLPIGEYVYDIQIKDTNDKITTVMRGKYIIVWQVTERTDDGES